MTKETTREKILFHGAEIVHKKGFNNTGIQEILQSAGVPKGSFYFYFKSKEHFGLELIDYYFDFFALMTGSHLKDPAVPPLERLRRFFGGLRAICEEQGCTGGCPIGNLAQEMGGLSDPFQNKLRDAFGKMKAGIVECLRQALVEHAIYPSLEIDETADFILNSWEGALLRMKAEGSVAPLILFEKMVFERVLKR